MTRPYCVGLTGGVGSGKSLVASLFANHGIAIVDTDRIARELTGPGGVAMAAIAETFGHASLAADGSLDRAWMRARVFADAYERRRLEAILHPLIRRRAAEQLESSDDAPYALLVVPLLIESGAYGALIDRVLVIDCAPERQIERIVRRDGVSGDLARAMLAAQVDREHRLAAADDVIDNDGDVSLLAAKVAALHEFYSRAAESHGSQALR